MTQTYVIEVQKTLPTTSTLWNKESPSQGMGPLQTSAHLQTKQEESVQAPPGFAGPPGHVCSGAFQGDGYSPQREEEWPLSSH